MIRTLTFLGSAFTLLLGFASLFSKIVFFFLSLLWDSFSLLFFPDQILRWSFSFFKSECKDSLFFFICQIYFLGFFPLPLAFPDNSSFPTFRVSLFGGHKDMPYFSPFTNFSLTFFPGEYQIPEYQILFF